jgi:hypothetical protein
MGEIVNLRRARKEAAGRAAANRMKFGATLPERGGVRAELNLAARRLDAHRRDQAAALATACIGATADIGVGPSGNCGDGE